MVELRLFRNATFEATSDELRWCLSRSFGNEGEGGSLCWFTRSGDKTYRGVPGDAGRRKEPASSMLLLLMMSHDSV